MKNIGLIAFGVIVLTVVAFVVLIATQPTAHVSIYSLAPTGAFQPGFGMPYQTWRFVITNDGGGAAVWKSNVEYEEQGLINKVCKDCWINGVALAHGKSAAIDMEVPVNTNWVWRGCVIYNTKRSVLMQKLWGVEKHLPFLSKIDPTWRLRTSFEAWHGTTNVATAAPTGITTP
jgi:hypothetical protein